MSCERDVVAQPPDLRTRAGQYMNRDGHVAEDRAESWNLRDTHIMGTLEALIDRTRQWSPGKAIVWAHNPHLGDARATQMRKAP